MSSLRLAVGLIVLTVVALMSACGDDDSNGESTRPTAVAPTTVMSPTTAPEPTSTPRPPILTTPATIDGCPVDDPPLCALAIELQNALNEDNLPAFLASLAPREFPCAELPALTGDDVGCASATDTSDPVVAFFNFGSDCCYTTPTLFEQRLDEWLAEMDRGRPWRLYGIVPKALLTDDMPAVVLVQGTDVEAPLLYVLTFREGLDYTTHGVIRGTHGALFLRPSDTLAPWR